MNQSTRQAWNCALRLSLVLLGLVGFLAGGCNPAWTTPERYDRGMVMVLPGIEGAGPLNLRICDGLYAGGVDKAIVLRDWSGLLGPIGNQRDEIRNRQVADQIAAEIVAYQDEYPNQPVILIGHSGGSAIAVWTAEAMPDGRHVDGVILLASSLSNKYDLRLALEKSSRGIINFYSHKDRALLGVGTGAVGTMDGKHSTPAGRRAFVVPENSYQLWAYEGLHQVAWSPQFRALDHRGGHGGYTHFRFIRDGLSPVIMAESWSQSGINALLAEACARKGATQPATQPASQPMSQPTTGPADDIEVIEFDPDDVPAEGPPEDTAPADGTAGEGALIPVAPCEEPEAKDLTLAEMLLGKAAAEDADEATTTCPSPAEDAPDSP